jgi:hypothetical protein
MANFYSDSHDERWGVMMQQKKVSCGLACAAMAEVYIKAQVQENMEAVFRQISQRFPENFKEDRGASMDNVVNVLRSRGIHCSITTTMVRVAFGHICILMRRILLRSSFTSAGVKGTVHTQLFACMSIKAIRNASFWTQAMALSNSRALSSRHTR